MRDKSKLDILIIGPGRIGSALIAALHNQGHSLSVIKRTGSKPRNELIANLSKSLNNVRWQDIDIVFFAVATENSEYFDGLASIKSEFTEVAELSNNIPLISVSGNMSISNLKSIFGDRPIARFFCSSAIENAQSLRFYDQASDQEVITSLKQLFYSKNWKAVETKKFERWGTILISSALAIKPLLAVKNNLDINDLTEQSFLLETIEETLRIIKANEDDLEIALDSASTPGGNTVKLLEQFFKQT